MHVLTVSHACQSSAPAWFQDYLALSLCNPFFTPTHKVFHYLSFVMGPVREFTGLCQLTLQNCFQSSLQHHDLSIGQFSEMFVSWHTSVTFCLVMPPVTYTTIITTAVAE